MRTSSLLPVTLTLLVLLCVSPSLGSLSYVGNYTADWASLDARPTPQWYDDAKFGIFFHWGVYSVPSIGHEWFWKFWKDNKPEYVNFVKKNYPPGFTYQEFAKDFTTENFDPDAWVRLIKASGAKYVVLTSKHHDGYTLWPSKYSFSWNSMDVGPRRDLVGDLAKAVKKEPSLVFGLYHSMFEWYNPMYEQDKKSGYVETEFVDKKCIPELVELIKAYEPEVVWSDGDWEAPDTYWRAKEFLAWLYNSSPVKDTVVTNDRWGKDTRNKHGGVWTGQDHWNPGSLVTHKWENAMTIDHGSWGYRQSAALADYRSDQELIDELVSTVSCGGNLLLNVGPSMDGTITPIFELRLRNMGKWLEVNGEAIYKSQPWTSQNDKTKTVWYTMQPSATQNVYAIVLRYPESNSINLYSIKSFVTDKTKVKMLGYDKELKMTVNRDHVTVEFPSPFYSYKISSLAWTLEFSN